jgi:hypothetical protein
MTHSSRVHVLIPPPEAERFEAYCKAKGHKKSTLIVRLIRDHLDRERFETQQDLLRAVDRGGKK